MIRPLFISVDAVSIAEDIRHAQHSVCYAAPGIQWEPAVAIVNVANRIGRELIDICLDFDERVLRLGFGDLKAVDHLQKAGIVVRSTPGLRTGLLLVDHQGYMFSPTALYLEPDQRTAAAPNAIRLSEQQATEALARLSPAAKAIAIGFAKSDEEKERIRQTAIEVPSRPVGNDEFSGVQKSLEEVPPVRFDVARQVRVYSAYLQYVEMKLTGAAIQRHRLAIPRGVQKVGTGKDIEGRLKTTFDLVERSSKLSSKKLEDELNEIRSNFTPSLGEEHGRVLLKSAKPHFEKRIEKLRADLDIHKETVRNALQDALEASKKEVISYYIPLVMANPPDELRGGVLKMTDEIAEKWLVTKLDTVFPKADDLITSMRLEVRYKDVTYESLNDEKFLGAVKAAFPFVDWDKAHQEFQAAGESNPKR